MNLLKVPDNQLIGIKDESPSSPHALVAGYSLMKLFHFVIYYGVTVVLGDANAAVILFFPAIVVEFMVVKNVCGWALIGVAWKIAPDEEDGFIVFTAKPAPFVPTFVLADAFWIGFFVALILWTLAVLIGLVHAAWLQIFLAGAGLAAQLMNMLMFLRAQGAAQRAAATIARSAIADTAIRFAMVQEEDSSASPE